MPNLFELDRNFLEIENKIIEAGGELTPELENEYDEILDLMIRKENGYVYINESFNSQINAGKEIVKRLQSKIKAMENRQNKLKQRLIEHMQNTDKIELETELGKIKLTSNSKVIDLPVTEYPEQYIKTEIVQKVDKVSLKKDAKTDEKLTEKYIEKTFSIRLY